MGTAVALREASAPPAWPETAFQVVHRARPFVLEREVQHLPVGLTLAEIVERTHPDPVYRDLAVVRFGDGEPIPRERWHCIRPKAGTMVSVVPVPQNGQTARIALIIALAVVVSVATAGIGTALAGTALGVVGAGIVAGVAGSAISIAGPSACGLITAPFPPPEVA